MKVRLRHFGSSMREKRTMVIAAFFAQIEEHECQDIDLGALWVMQDIRRHDVQVRGGLFQLLVKIAMGISQVTQFVHESWIILESSEFALPLLRE